MRPEIGRPDGGVLEVEPGLLDRGLAPGQRRRGGGRRRCAPGRTAGRSRTPSRPARRSAWPPAPRSRPARGRGRGAPRPAPAPPGKGRGSIWKSTWPFSHVLALAERDPDDRPADLRLHRHGLQRLDRAGGRELERHVAPLGACPTVTGTRCWGGAAWSAQAGEERRAGSRQSAVASSRGAVVVSWVSRSGLPPRGSSTPASCASCASDTLQASRASTCWARASASARLRGEQVEHAADAGLVSAERDLVRLLGAREQVLRRAHPAGRRSAARSRR